jgi:proline iminopeptidase
MAEPYPAIEPHDSGMLDVGDANRLYWEVCGNPQGQPALILHGGPGSGCSSGARRLFDPSVYRIVLFDQRNCGRSLPHASDLETDLHANTTANLLSDIEALRRMLGIERWVVFGSSWGSTLALVYAETYPTRVSVLVLSHVALTRWDDIHWLYHGVGQFFPKAAARFRAGAGAAHPDADLVEAYAALLESADPATREKAAQDWCDWEAAIVSTDPGHKPHPRYADPHFRMAFARIATHYFRNGGFLEGNQILRNADRLKGIPGVLIHGRRDLGTPLAGVEALAKVWPESELIVIDEAGHETKTPGVVEGIVASTDAFRTAL